MASITTLAMFRQTFKSVLIKIGYTDLLEMQFDETPLFDSLTGQALPSVADGRITLTENRPGIGVSLILSELGC